MKIQSLTLLCFIGSVQAAFRRVGTFYPCSQISPTCNTNITTHAEIVTASPDGNTLIYSDSLYRKIGFVNITDPTKPTPLGLVDVAPGEPTSVTVVKGFAVAVVDTSADFITRSGYFLVVNITTRTVLANISVGGQPDSVTASPDGSFFAVAVENERNENLPNPNPPQLPAGYIVLVNSTSSNPTLWTPTIVSVANFSNMDFPTDPEPEYVNINADGTIAATLQENNAVAIIDKNGTVLRVFSCGAVNLTQIDTVEEKNLINLTGSLFNRKRQPDAVAWLDLVNIATADEGDLSDGGSRSWTIFDTRDGSIVYTSGVELEWLSVKIGHYPEVRIKTSCGPPNLVGLDS
jgi:hypothetical protein